MFETMLGRGERLARRRAQVRRRRLGFALRREVPPGILVEEVEDGLALVGRQLGERYGRDPQLRWLLSELVR